MLAALLPVALSAPLCSTPDAIAALSGAALPSDPRMLAAPPDLRIGVHSGAPPPPDAKPIYGTPYEGHAVSDNFLVTWAEGTMDEEHVSRTLEDLEDGWHALVEEQGWPMPVSSDTWKLWVVLDPSLAGTGFTTTYSTPEYPDGYPVIYLNPSYAPDVRFWRSLTQHELAHALQYRLRSYTPDPGEPWYWEASAQWQAELADPDNDGHLYTAAWYAERPGDRFDSMIDSHQYGMFVLNAFLEEQITGPDGLRQVWLLAAERPGTPWDEILAESTDSTPAELWAGFSSAYGNRQLVESPGYAIAFEQGTLGEGVGGAVAYLGSDYWSVPVSGDVSLLTDAPEAAILGAPGETGACVSVSAGDVLTVSGLTDSGAVSYTLTLEHRCDGSEDSGIGNGTETGDDGSADGRSGKETAGGCSAAPLPGALGLVALPLLVGRRRQDRGV